MKLVIFDVDGTLVDSQSLIFAAMDRAFTSLGMITPEPAAVRDIIGLSLPHVMQRLAPEESLETQDRLVEAYKNSFMTSREAGNLAPLYPGAREALEALAEREDVVLGIATGKSRRGLEKMLEAHGLKGWFMTRQVADDHPSKPHPSMIQTAIRETGIERAVMIGDTVYDMDMAANAGVPGLGVAWGYHAPERLTASGAREVMQDYASVVPALERLWEA